MDALLQASKVHQQSGDTFAPIDSNHFNKWYLTLSYRFTGNVKLKCVALLGGENDSHPKSMKLYKNIDNMSFDQTEKKPDQSFELPSNHNDILQLPTK